MAQAYGDIFTVSSPYVDKATQQIYQEQKQKDLEQQKMSAALDADFSKELINIKKADIPDVVKSYGDYKQSYINLLKKGNKATPQDQYDVLEKRANVGSLVNGSISDKERLKTHTTALPHDNKGLYASDAAQKIQQQLNTPTSKIDYNTADSDLMNKYTVPDINKEVNAAWGKNETLRIPTGQQSKTDPLKDVVEYYNKGNNPNDAYNNLFTSIVSNKNVRERDNFSNVMANQYSDAEAEDLQNKYLAKIADPNYIKVYGKTAPFPQAALQTKLGKAVALKVMEKVVNDELIPTTKEEINTDRQTKQRQQFQREQQQRTFNNAELRQQLGFKHTDSNRKSNDEVIVDYAKILTSAVRGGDIDAIKNAFSKLAAGGKFLRVEYNPVIPGLTQEPAFNVVTLKNGKEENNIFKANDPYLEDRMKGVINTSLKVAEKKEIQKGMTTLPSTLNASEYLKSKKKK